MRSGVLAFAILLGGAFALSACDQNKTAENPSTSQVPAIIATGYDLTPESNTRYLEDNKTRAGVMVTADGLQYRVLNAGSGATPKVGDTVTVTYKGQMIDGTVFDQTAPGETAMFQAGGVIPGWNEALSMMKEGDHWELAIPAALAYPEGRGPIPPGQTLVFDVTLLSVTPQ